MSGSPVSLMSEDAPIANPIISIDRQKEKRARVLKKRYIQKTDKCFSKDPAIRLKRLFSRSVITEIGCMEWVGCYNKNGYGYAGVWGIVDTVPRHIYRLIHQIKVLPKGSYICHHCDNRKCINPDHLFIGTQKENMMDCSRKGRAPNQIQESITSIIKDKIRA